MFLDDLLTDNKLSLYKLSQQTLVPYSTLTDIRSGKAKLENCSVKVVKRIADAFRLSVNELLDYAEDFEIFRCNTLHHLKYSQRDELCFLNELLSSERIEYYFKMHSYSKALYLLALADYLCDKHHVKRVTKYEPLRKLKLKKLLMSNDLLLIKRVVSEERFSEIISSMMPEFLKYNIVEDDLYNVY